MSADESNSHTETQTAMSHHSNPFNPAMFYSAEYDSRVYSQSFHDFTPAQSHSLPFSGEPYINAAPFQPRFTQHHAAPFFISEDFRHDWVSRGQQNLNINAHYLQ